MAWILRRPCRRFISIPSVSTDPAYGADMARGAAFLAEEMTRLRIGECHGAAGQRAIPW